MNQKNSGGTYYDKHSTVVILLICSYGIKIRTLKPKICINLLNTSFDEHYKVVLGVETRI